MIPHEKKAYRYGTLSSLKSPAPILFEQDRTQLSEG